MNDFDYVIYHENCMDGTSSAWVTTLVNPNAKLIPSSAYKSPDPNIYPELNTVTCNKIVFCDVTPTKPFLDLLIWHENKIVVIDHHNDAICKLENYIKTSCTTTEAKLFTLYTNKDNTKSGCVLTWEYFFPDKPIPWFLEYISDRDNWSFKLEYSKEINSALYEDKHITFEGLNQLLTADITDMKNSLIKRGTTLEDVRLTFIEKYAKLALLCKYKEMYVWLYQCLPEYRIDVGNYLLDKTTTDKEGNIIIPDFSACWQYDIKSDHYWFSARSNNNKVDICEIAKSLDTKGGGHRNASGFSIIGGNIKLRDIFVPV